MKYSLIIFAAFMSPFMAFAKLQVATTTTDLEAIVKMVGKDQVEVFSIAKGTQDPHQIDAKPSFMVKLRNADVVLAQGLELEAAWIVPLVRGARNSKLFAKEGVFELASLLDPIEVSSGNISRAEGDIHPGGNPHFQLDPIRLGKAAILIANRLSELDPLQKEFFTKNARDFQNQMENKAKDWSARIKKSAITQIVTYHKSFSYFCDRFNLQCSIQLEPKPGIPPTASHILSVIDQMKKKQIKLVMIENLYDDSVKPKLLKEIPSAVVERVPVSVGGEPGILTNEELIEKIVRTVEAGAH